MLPVSMCGSVSVSLPLYVCLSLACTMSLILSAATMKRAFSLNKVLIKTNL